MAAGGDLKHGRTESSPKNQERSAQTTEAGTEAPRCTKTNRAFALLHYSVAYIFYAVCCYLSGWTTKGGRLRAGGMARNRVAVRSRPPRSSQGNPHTWRSPANRKGAYILGSPAGGLRLCFSPVRLHFWVFYDYHLRSSCWGYLVRKGGVGIALIILKTAFQLRPGPGVK